LARYGGEEFVIILPHIDVIGAQRFAEKCLVTLRKLNLVHQQRLDDKQIVTMSIGGALMDHSKHYSNADALIRCADLRLYQAKQQRDCAIVN
jgi:diguanylate cyclase (GGDEF)-like protein